MVPGKVVCTPSTLMPEVNTGVGTGKCTANAIANMVVVVVVK